MLSAAFLVTKQWPQDATPEVLDEWLLKQKIGSVFIFVF